MKSEEDCQSILKYWFGDFDSNVLVIENKAALWWGKDVSTDSEITERFADKLGLLQTGHLQKWKRLPESYFGHDYS